MNREQINRIRLKVITTTGIHILCTALKDSKVSEWLPHFQEAYREVKEDQGDDEHSKKRFIRAVRIKKGEFYVANSEIIGDVFDDNDQVFCEILFPNSKSSSKFEKQQKKKERYKSILNVPEEEVIEQKNSEEMEEVEETEIKEKEVKKAFQKQEKARYENLKEIHHKREVFHPNSSPAHQKKQTNKQLGSSPFNKSQLLKRIDISQLKQRLMIKPSKSSPPQQLGSGRRKEVVEGSNSPSEEDEQS